MEFLLLLQCASLQYDTWAATQDGGVKMALKLERYIMWLKTYELACTRRGSTECQYRLSTASMMQNTSLRMNKQHKN